MKGIWGACTKRSPSSAPRVSYPALTAFCRRHGIGSAPPPPAGHYLFTPGQEMQHDTSPHQARIAGNLTRVQTASVVLCYSRMIFFQHYPRFTRFECKAFLAQAIDYFHGSAGRCMVDNSNVVVASGTGATMIPAPEMAAFAARYGFVFVAHEKGDANRSARVEAPFQRIETGLLGRRALRRLDGLEPTRAGHVRGLERQVLDQAACQPPRTVCRRTGAPEAAAAARAGGVSALHPHRGCRRAT